MRRWIIDASPIISLASAGHIQLLDSLCGELRIPNGVAAEVRPPGRDDSASRWMEANWTRVLRPSPAIDPRVAGRDLGLGESEVISEALKIQGFEVILDDQAARECALSLGLKVRGTVGIVVLAKKEGIIPAAAPLLDDLRWIGLRMDDALIARALKMAGEAE